jgi:hypothetical protein
MSAADADLNFKDETSLAVVEDTLEQHELQRDIEDPSRKRDRDEFEGGTDTLAETADEAKPQSDDIEEPSRKRDREEFSEKKLNNEQWETMFDRLVAYKEEHGVSFGFLESIASFFGLLITRVFKSGLLGTKAVYC